MQEPNWQTDPEFDVEASTKALYGRINDMQVEPFTLQRLCELLVEPKKYYSRMNTFIRALEKCLFVRNVGINNN